MTRTRQFIQLKTELPGPNSRALIARREAAMPAGYGKATDIAVRRAHGALVEDVDGNVLIDFAGGIGVLNVGHTPPEVVAAIKAQAEAMIHVCGLVATTEPHVQLAEKLNAIAPIGGAKKAMITNTGAEAVEQAIQIARAATGRQAIIAFEGAYHGRTLLTQTLTSKYALFKKGFGPFAPEIYRAPFPYLYRTAIGTDLNEAQKVELVWEAFERFLVAHVMPEHVAAVIIEPVQGEGGFIPTPREFMHRLRDVCTRYGILLIADEVQCGFARTGKMFAIQHYDVEPDMVVMAKSMGAGMPIAATVGRAEVMDKVHLGGLGGTYSGNPVACAAALQAIALIERDDLCARAAYLGSIACTRLKRMQERFALIGDVRGLGAMLAVEFVEDRASRRPLSPEKTVAIVRDIARNGVLSIRCGLYSNGLRFLFPLVISEAQLHEGLDVVEEALERASA
ncbi:MAG: 4-aminobutyrate--2-oxoglutarate transaminase [Anaerolineae bacterium]|nr:4-aminobutyrate--2-oxoglutarate transaminase [Candidatus Roseilinea sp.]MDW8448512.1 4-aminobutyrate--2-oxoglutarate transaminase [Anaerolineae bacterium]